jgi:glycosyltransferase involved in cell wall biosynthesis
MTDAGRIDPQPDRMRGATDPGASPTSPRLLVLASTYPRWPGDPEPAFVHELARRLAGDFAVTALVPHAPGAAREEWLDGVRVQRFRYAPLRWQTLVNDGGIVANLRRRPWKYLLVPGFLASLAWSAWRVARRERPQAVHAHWLIPQGVVAAWLAGRGRRAGLLVTSHGADLFALRARPLRWLKAWVARRADRVTVVSEAMVGELERLGIDRGHVDVRPMGVDLRARFVPDPSVPRSTHELLFVGRLVEKKGLTHLVAALPAVLAQRPDCRLTVAGFGPEEDALRAQCRALGIADRVDFLGPVAQDALPALYRRATVFVAPFVQAASGDAEGLGLVMIEAAGCGCPVVASDLPAVRDVLEDRVPPGDPAALAAHLLAVLAQSPETRAGRAAALRARLLERFDWQAVAAGYADLLRQLRSAGR